MCPDKKLEALSPTDSGVQWWYSTVVVRGYSEC